MQRIEQLLQDPLGGSPLVAGVGLVSALGSGHKLMAANLLLLHLKLLLAGIDYAL